MQVPVNPVIRIWGGHRESDWNEYWIMHQMLLQQNELAAAFQQCGVTEIDICPALRSRAPVVLHRVEIFFPGAVPPTGAQAVCDEIYRITGRHAVPVAAENDTQFRSLVSERQLYLRQRFELWDEVLPRLTLGVDFNSGRHTRLRPAQPEKWRLVDHDVEMIRHVMPALMLDPSEKGRNLLADLKKELYDWYKGDFRGRVPLNQILQYRRILERYGVDCNEAFRYGLADGWFPIDVEHGKDWNAARELCATPLPDNPGDLLLDEENKPVGWYGAIFFFVAITD